MSAIKYNDAPPLYCTGVRGQMGDLCFSKSLNNFLLLLRGWEKVGRMSGGLGWEGLLCL